MNSHHTPGPWRVSPSGRLVCTDEGTHVNICTIEDNGNDALAPLPNEVAPNARLIAAAPELLATLDKLHALAGENGVPLDFVKLAEFQNTVFRLAAQAIAKAKGQA